MAGVGIMIIAIIAYYEIRLARAEQLHSLEDFEKRAEIKLDVVPVFV